MQVLYKLHIFGMMAMYNQLSCRGWKIHAHAANHEMTGNVVKTINQMCVHASMETDVWHALNHYDFNWNDQGREKTHQDLVTALLTIAWTDCVSVYSAWEVDYNILQKVQCSMASVQDVQ